jgi:hypothetical protein
MDLAPWMAQLGLGTAAVVLFLVVGKSYINYIGRLRTEDKAAHREELDRLTDVWKDRLAAEVRRGDAWETAASRHQAANLETTEQLRRLTPAVETTVSILRALQDQGRK